MKKQSVSMLNRVPNATIAGRLRTILATTAAFWFGALQAQAPSTIAARKDADSRAMDTFQLSATRARPEA